MQRAFVVIPTYMIVLTKTHLAMGMLVLSSLNFSFTLMCIPLGFLLCRWPLWNVMLEGVCLHDHKQCHMQSRKELQANIWPSKGLWKYDSLAHFPRIANECKRQILQKKLLQKWLQRIVVFTVVASCFCRRR